MVAALAARNTNPAARVCAAGRAGCAVQPPNLQAAPCAAVVGGGEGMRRWYTSQGGASKSGGGNAQDVGWRKKRAAQARGAFDTTKAAGPAKPDQGGKGGKKAPNHDDLADDLG